MRIKKQHEELFHRHQGLLWRPQSYEARHICLSQHGKVLQYTIAWRCKCKWQFIFNFTCNPRLHNYIDRILFIEMSGSALAIGRRYRAKVIAACLTFSSLLFFTMRILRGFDGHVSLNTLPEGEDSSKFGRGGTMSGLRKGNVGGGPDDNGGCCRRVGVVWFNRDLVERNVPMYRY
jgi:hypothetical protein